MTAASEPGARIVLITGASSGIGRACAVRFAAAGDTVVGVARHAPALDELAGEAAGVETRVCDVRNAEQRAALVHDVLARHGRVDVLVNNAGVGAIGMLHELTGSDVERVYETDVVAVADLTRLVLPSMLARGRGAVVMISSVAAWVSGPPGTVYASSKFAVDGLVEGLRRERRPGVPGLLGRPTRASTSPAPAGRGPARSRASPASCGWRRCRSWARSSTSRSAGWLARPCPRRAAWSTSGPAACPAADRRGLRGSWA